MQYYLQLFRVAILFHLILMCFTGIVVAQDPLFDLRPCSREELKENLSKQKVDMQWDCGANSFRFVCTNEETYFEIRLVSTENLESDLLCRIKDFFTEIETEEGKQRVFSYRVKADGTEEINIPISDHAPHANSVDYLIRERRERQGANPIHLNVDDLAVIIKDSNVLIYTGAGISASVVPKMDALQQLLGLEIGDKFLLSLEVALNEPKNFAKNIQKLYETFTSLKATKAHLVLKEILFFKKAPLFTENLDCLHEASGINPYRIVAKDLRSQEAISSLQKIDYVICIGLSHDDRGFLSQFKACHPEGKIISLDLNSPSYLGDEDMLLKGDIQETLPILYDLLVNQ